MMTGIHSPLEFGADGVLRCSYLIPPRAAEEESNIIQPRGLSTDAKNSKIIVETEGSSHPTDAINVFCLRSRGESSLILLHDATDFHTHGVLLGLLTREGVDTVDRERR